MKVLVTGGTGFLGKKLAYRLKEMGYETVAFGRNKKIGMELEKDGITFFEGSLEDLPSVLKASEGVEYVFHCGAKSSPWGTYEEFYQTNYKGTDHVINACVKNKVKRMIHVSTPSLYFRYDERLDVQESDPLPTTFANDYAKTKHMAEELVQSACQYKGFPAIIIRPRAIFGPGDNAILPRLIKVNEEKFIPLINNGNALLNLTYVENVVDVLVLCMHSPPSTLGQTYNITNGETVVLREILKELFEELDIPFKTKKIPFNIAFGLASFLEWFSKTFQNGKEPLLTKYTVSVLAKSQTLNIDKAKRELGYIPRISIKKGMDEFVKWWKEELK